MTGHNNKTSLALLLIIAVTVVCSSVLRRHGGNFDRITRRTIVGCSSFMSLSVADAFAPSPTFPSRSFRLEGIMMVSACKMHNSMGTSYPHKTHHVVLSSSTTGNDVGHHTADTEKEPTPVNNSNPSTLNNNHLMDGFDSVVNKRYACTRFQRYQEPTHNTENGTEESAATNANAVPQAAISDQSVVKSAYKCLELSQRAPTGFNAQPYRVILVHSKEDKERLSQYCLGRNADRVRDSDCTAVFLADRQCGRDGKRYTNFLVNNMDPPPPQNEHGTSDDTRPLFNSMTRSASTTIAKANTSRTRRPLSSKALLKLRMLIMLFSSGYPLPRFLNVPFSWGVRTAVSILSFFARCLQSMKQRFRILSKLFPSDIQMLPTLSSAETWAQKNTMLAAMIYMLACTSRGLATCPMEGIDAAGVRKVLVIPRRYSIPLIVSTGTPYRRSVNEISETDDVGMSHGDDGNFSPRYSLQEVVFGNNFGVTCDLT